VRHKRRARSLVSAKEKKRAHFLERSARARAKDERRFSKREKIPKKRTLQHPRMTFTVFHHASIRVPGRLERPSAVGRLHRAGGGPFFFVVVVVVLVVVVVVFFFFSVGEFDESFHVLRRHRGVFEPLSYSEKRGERVVFGGVRKGARKRARSVRDAQTIAFKPRAILFSVECAKKPARSRVACALRRALPGNTLGDDDAPLLKYTRL
jgi:hypothetical protein